MREIFGDIIEKVVVLSVEIKGEPDFKRIADGEAGSSLSTVWSSHIEFSSEYGTGIGEVELYNIHADFRKKYQAV